jgi:parallel beta-helix repeat protein
MWLCLLVASVAEPCLARTVKVSSYPQLAAACRSGLPGDTILLAPGVYTITEASRIDITNRPGPVVVKGATGVSGDVIVEGRGQDDEAVQMVFDLTDSPHWTFQDLTTRNSYYHGFKFNGGSSDCVLRHVVMRDHGESGVKGTSNPALGRYPDRLRVEGCDIGFSSLRGGTRSVVEGIDGVGVNGWIVRGSRFVNVTHQGSVAYGVFTKGNSSDTIIESCRFENCDIGASFGGGGTGAPYFRDNDRQYEHRGGIIRNNVIVRSKDAGVYINKGKECKIYNNTLFECGLSIQLRFPESSGWVRNNLVKPSARNSDEPAVRARDGATLLANEANLIATNADFMKPTGEDTQIDVDLRPGSSAIDAGTPVGTDVPTDLDGGRRPFGKAIDIGAYERR